MLLNAAPESLHATKGSLNIQKILAFSERMRVEYKFGQAISNIASFKKFLTEANFRKILNLCAGVQPSVGFDY